MAAQSRQALRSRIKSVKNTRKITKAMEMIANAKLFRQRTKMEANREYAQRLQDTVNEIVSRNQDAESIYLVKNNSSHKMTIVFCSDLGLCGGYNANILRTAREQLDTEDPIYIIGTSLYSQFKEYGFHPLNDAPVSSDGISFQDLKKIIEDGTLMYRDNKVGAVQLLYTEFVNTMSFVPNFDVLLPCEPEKNEEKKETAETLFEPNPEEILDHLIPMMIQDVAYSDWMESTTSEQGSRRVAMKTASDNADDLGSSLQLAYNKARQAAITQEITEIVGGSNAV
jgi:F-type H+-transporting ATPase subunit gamma